MSCNTCNGRGWFPQSVGWGEWEKVPCNCGGTTDDGLERIIRTIEGDDL